MTRLFSPLVLLFLPAASLAQANGDLLRNGNFQDDWLTLVPQVKNHHWCYSSEFYHRRDFNPDGWDCAGSWEWHNADAPWGQRHFVLQGPKAEVRQRVNWVLVHSPKQMGNMADAGGFPSIVPQRSQKPLALVRDLTFSVLLRGDKVPAKAGTIELSLCPPGGLTISSPHGTKTKPTITVSAPLLSGTYSNKIVEVKLAAKDWLAAVEKEAKANPKEAAELAKNGPVLPGTVEVAIRYQGAAGHVTVAMAGLSAAAPEAPNLLPNGHFTEITDKKPISEDSWPAGWSKPTKYRHFPGRLYYLFNTWHNAAFDNRGLVRLDPLISFIGSPSLQMIVPSGDEVAVTSDPIALNQKEPRLLEVHAWVKTDQLAMLHIDAVDETGKRLSSFPFIHMAPHSIGTNDWRLIRQVFRPTQPTQKIRLLLCARGVNGYTLDDTGHQPQNNVTGMIWWNSVKLFEPESTVADLDQRGVKHDFGPPAKKDVPFISRLILQDPKPGVNDLRVELFLPAQYKSENKFSLDLDLVAPSGKKHTFEEFAPDTLPKIKGARVYSSRLQYDINELCKPYSEYHATLTVRDGKKVLGSTQLWFSTWTVPMKLELGALYLRPEQKQFVRLNLGFSPVAMKDMMEVKLEVVRKSTGKVLKKQEISAMPGGILGAQGDIAAQREKLPEGLRDDLTNLLLADLDVSYLPVQPFHDPERNWVVRASAVDKNGKVVAMVESPPFCRLAHEPPQPAVKSVTIKKGLLYVNDQPWMPWGAVYGHVPVYDGPADSGKYLDLHNLKPWSMYDRFTGATYKRKLNDFNCLRYVAASITDPKALEKAWQDDNVYASSVFVVPQPVFSLPELELKAGGAAKLAAYLAFCKSAPMVISTAPGIEEAFGLFHSLTPAQLQGLEQVVTHLRTATGKPVMVGHGGYWNRLEFEKVPFFDIFDPETEPLYPANLHTDLAPLIQGKNKVIWLRPQMYESVPYERWRFHVFVELMRGCTGWQIAHGPGDASLFRGLHGELEFFKPIVYSQDAAPKIATEPPLEHWCRKHHGKTYIMAATTRPLALGKWHWHDEAAGAPGKRSRLTTAPHLYLSEANSYGADQDVPEGPAVHGIHYLPDAKSWPAGTKLVQWVKLDGKHLPENLAVLVKREGRWNHAATWGDFKAASWNDEPKKAMWFLHSFYRHAYGFLGWDDKLVDKAKPYLLTHTKAQGPLPKAGDWVKLEFALDQIGIKDGMIDGVGSAHTQGKVWWGPTSLVTPDGKETLLFGDALEHPPEALAKTKIVVPGLKTGTKVRVLFEDRELTAKDGYFIDDFRGQDLYQRYGGGYGVGYGNGPVALHQYEILGP